MIPATLVAALIFAIAIPGIAAGQADIAPPAGVTAAPRPSPRLEPFYDIGDASPRELRRINADNASIIGIRIGDSLQHLNRTLERPKGKRVEKSLGRVHHTVFRYDDLQVRVNADERIARIKVMASGAWMMHNALRDLMTDFSERRLQQILGWNYRRKLKRVYVWPISRTRFMQDSNRDRLLGRVMVYYDLASVAQAEKKIIKAWDTVYIYDERGIHVRVYSNIPVSGRFKADFVLIKPQMPSLLPSPDRDAGPVRSLTERWNFA